MAFGIPGSEAATGSSGAFLGRLQYDTRVGFWKVVKRIQNSDGSWGNEESAPFQKITRKIRGDDGSDMVVQENPTLMLDFLSLEVGFIKFASPPVFLVVPYGKAIPAWPDEMITNAQGQKRKAFLPGFRIKVAGQRVFGDLDAYYFAHNSQTVMNPMDELHQLYMASPEARAGKLPIVAVTGTKVVEFSNTQGTSKFYAPVFEIKSWQARLPVFGEATVAGPSVAAAPVKTNGGARHVQAPVANAPENDRAAGPPAGHPVNAPPPIHNHGGGALTDDDIPFAAEWR